MGNMDDKNYQSIGGTGGDEEAGGGGETAALVAPSPPRNNLRKFPEMKALVGEFMGTCTYVQIGCGMNCVAVLLMSSSANSDYSYIKGIVWSLALLLGVYISAASSGGHLNPAVSLSFALVRWDDFPFQSVLPYWIVQLLGAFVAGLINQFLFTTAISNFEQQELAAAAATADSTTTTDDILLESASAFGNYWRMYGNVESAFHAAVIEGFGTGFVCFIIFAATNPRTCVPPSSVPIFVGIAYGVMVMVFGPLTGAALNPARDMGPRLVTLFGHWGSISMTDWLPYLLGPLIGGPIGAFLADRVLLLQD